MQVQTLFRVPLLLPLLTHATGFPFLLEQWLLTWVIMPFRRQLAMSRDTSGCHSLGGGRGSTRISRLEIKEANILQHTG